MDVALAFGAVAVAVVVYLRLRPKPQPANVPEDFLAVPETATDELLVEGPDEHLPLPATADPATAENDDDGVVGSPVEVPEDRAFAPVDEPQHGNGVDESAPLDNDEPVNATEADSAKWGFQTMFGLDEDKATALRRRIEEELANTDGRRRMMESLEAELTARRQTAAAASTNGALDNETVPDSSGAGADQNEASDTEQALHTAISMLRDFAADNEESAQPLPEDSADALANAFSRLTRHRSG